MNIREQKQKIRKDLLERRIGLTEKEYAAKSRQITHRLTQQAEFQDAEIIHCYVSMNERNEVDTHPFIKELLQQGRKVAVPVTDFSNNTLNHFYLEDFEDLQQNKWGVLEPVRRERAELKDLDLIIVPMVGGDLSKNRIGYGKGFYDRFLNEANSRTIGLLFERCLLDSVPVENFDISLQKLITEKRVVS